jgi:hypothetical protein
MISIIISLAFMSPASSFVPPTVPHYHSKKHTTRCSRRLCQKPEIGPLSAGRLDTDISGEDSEGMVEISLSENNLLSFLSDHDDGGEPDVEDLLAFETALDVDALEEFSGDVASANLFRAISSETLPVDMVVGDKSLPGDLGFDPLGFSKLDPFVVLHKNRLQLIDGERQVKKR